MEKNTRQSGEQGVALLLMLFILMGGATAFFLYSWNGGQQNIERERITQAALEQAKEALLGRAVASASTPGRFPCPEQLGTTLEGQADTNCNTQAKRLGRLPWKTLDQEKLLDGYGEPLWYAISENFTTSPINSNTPPLLNLDGSSNRVVALIIAPGPAIPGQNRSIPSATTPPKSTDYLDLENAAGISFMSNGPLSSFNDKVISVTQTELLQLLHKRVLSEVRGLDALTGGLKLYYNEHGQFPWADSNGDGIADTDQTTGKLPYLPNGTLVFYADTKKWLDNNNWFPLISYIRTTPASAQISLGSLSMKVLPCTAAPCP